VSKPTTFVRRKGRGPRPPDPYVDARSDGRFDVGCRSCRVVVAGLVDEITAKTWAENHRCAEATTTVRRPWP
jgi:hypothetical protein